MTRPFYTLLTLLTVTLMLNSCSSTPAKKLTPYAGETPVMYLENYFNGPIKAWGMVQDYKGHVTRRFDADLYGVWDGKQGKIYEVFRYYDGELYKRVWALSAELDNGFSGTAHDITGTAKGNQSGNAAFWNYVMQVPVGDKIYDIAFDDRMWLMNDGVLMNRSKMKKFGLTVGNVTVFMQKQPADGANDARPEVYETLKAHK